MKLKYLILTLIIFNILSGCNKGNEETDFKVSGKLESNGEPLVDAKVDIDGLLQYQAMTDEAGNFTIENVPAGTHKLNANKTGTNNSFIQKSYDIVLTNEDLNLASIKLPNPVLIDTIILDSTTNLATILWNASSAEDFREYKLYSHTTSGLDETTGVLEHVSTNRNDTSKQLQLEGLTEKYFRVFVMNEYGQLGGSNIRNVSTCNISLLYGGEFESNQDLSYWDWTAQGEVLISNVNAYSGLGCLYIQSEIDTVDNNLSGTIDRWPTYEWEFSSPIALEENRTYTLSFWYKLSGFGYMMYPFNFYYVQDNEEKIYTTIYDYDWSGVWIPNSPFKILDDTGWLYFSLSFTSDSNSKAVFYLSSEVEKVWIDNLELKVAE